MFTAAEAEVKPPSTGMWKVIVSVMIGLQVVWKFLDRKICGTGGEIEVLWYITDHLLNFKACLIAVDVFFYACLVSEAKTPLSP